MFAYPTTRKSHTLNSLHNRYTIGQSDTFESNPHSNCFRVKTNSVSLNKLLRGFKPKSFPNWLPTLKSGPSVVLLLFVEFWCRRPRHGAWFSYRTLPVSSGCLPVCISDYFCRRRKGDSHVKYKYTDSVKSRERQGTEGRGLTQPLTSLVPLASVLAASPRNQPCPGRRQRESTGQPPSWGLRRCWGP